MMAEEVDKVVSISLKHFNDLKSSLKPNENEWTSFASIVSKKDEKFKLISFAMGTKSVTGEKAKLTNLIVDTHAESLCRRSLKYYLANQLKQVKNDVDLSNVLDDEFHMVISQLPCGTVNRYRGSDNAIRKKPGRGDICMKGTCFDKILKWSIMGLQGRKLSAILTKPLRLKSIIIGNCSLDLTDHDKETFKRGFDLEFDSELEIKLRSFFNFEEQNSGTIDQQNERMKIELDSSPNKSEEPKQKKQKIDSNEEDRLIIQTTDSSSDLSGVQAASNLLAKSIMNQIKPEIHFCDTFRNEIFIREDHKRAQDRSIVYFLDFSLTSYRTEVICEGRKHGTTKQNYMRLPLTLSPNSLNDLIEEQIKKREMNLDQNKTIKQYDLIWKNLKLHHNFVMWSTDRRSNDFTTSKRL